MSALSKLNKYKVAKNASVLAVTQIISRVATIFYVAALARYVGTEGIGQISTASALNALLLLVVAPGLSILFVRDVAADVKKASSYVTSMVFLRLLLLTPFVLLTFLFAHSGNYPDETIQIIHLYTLVFIFDTLVEILISVFRSYERMEFEAGTQIARDVINIGLSLLAIYLRWPLIAIVFMSVFAQFCKLVLTFALVSRKFVRPSFSVDFSLSKTLLLASLPFGVLLVIHTFQAELGTFVLSLYYDANTVGLFAAANTLIVMLLFVPNAFAAAIFPNFARLHVTSRIDLTRYYQLCYKYLLVLGFPLGLGTMLVGDRVITLIYGEEFAPSASVIRIMAVFLFTIVGYANGTLLHTTGEQKFYAWTQALAALMNAGLCFALVPPLGPNGAALAFMVSGLFTFFVHSTFCHRKLDLDMPWVTVGSVFLATLVMGLAVTLGINAGINWLLVVLVVAPTVYVVMLFGLRIVKRDELRTLGSASPDNDLPQVAVAASAGD
jgi:O-antigen/teichoic acid export membrane protein